MSQVSQLNIYFVQPIKNTNNAQCSRDMLDAFNCVKQYKGKPQWVQPSWVLSYTPQMDDVFVFEEFKGKAFEKLKNDAAKILGAKCVLTCLSSGDTIPPGMSPVFTEGMRGLVVCCSGFDTATKKIIKERVEYMGGHFQDDLRSCVTHIVAKKNIVKKVIEGYKHKISIMTFEWVDAVWKRSQEANVRGNDEEFNKFISPLFNNLKISSSGTASRKRKEEIKNMIEQNGGSFMGSLEMNKTDILLIDKPEGEKYSAAKDWDIPCVTFKWLKDCIDLKKILPLNDYTVDKVKTSTPTKGQVTFTGNFSKISAIHFDRENILVDETLSQRSEASTSHDVISELAEEIMRASGAQFLDGCNIVLHPPLKRLSRALIAAGATVFDEMNPSVTHVITQGDYKTHDGVHYVPLQWLIDSKELKRPAPVDAYLTGEGKRSNPASPLSKKGARLLSRPEINVEEELPVPHEDELVNLYHQSQPGRPLTPEKVPNLTPRPDHSVSQSSNLTQTNPHLFQNLKFFISQDLTDEEILRCNEVITQYGGTVVPKKFTGIPNFAVVPVAGATLSEVTALQIVNPLFIKDCILENQIIPVQYYHKTFTWVRDSEPLEGCVVCVTNYLGSERDFIETVIETLGGIAQDILAKKQKEAIWKTTHLVCAEPHGKKYEGAVKWGVPVVHHDWLLQCAEVGTRIPERAYLLTETKDVLKTPHSSSDAAQKESPKVSTDMSHNVRQSVAQNTQKSNTPLRPPLAIISQPVTALSPKTPVVSSTSNLSKGPEVTDLNGTLTPDTPYGACYGGDPSPPTRKRLYKWINKGPDFTPDPPPKRPFKDQLNTSTPLSELFSKTLDLMVRKPRATDASPKPRRIFNNLKESECIADDVLKGLQEMREIEASCSRAVAAAAATPTAPSTTTSEQMMVVIESQPHTEIGWEDPTDLQRAVEEISEKPAKVFMFTGIEDVEKAKATVEAAGGKVSLLTTFDKTTTHLIAGVNTSRAEKLMCGLAKGLWVLHPSYLDEIGKVKDVHVVNEENFEWGNPKGKFDLKVLKSNVRDCMVSAYDWRRTVQVEKKPPALAEMKFIFSLPPSKADVFKRIVEVGGGEILTLDNHIAGERVYCITDSLTDTEMDRYARRNICCVSLLFISDIMLKRPQPVENNILKGFDCFWKRWQKS